MYTACGLSVCLTSEKETDGLFTTDARFREFSFTASRRQAATRTQCGWETGGRRPRWRPSTCRWNQGEWVDGPIAHRAYNGPGVGVGVGPSTVRVPRAAQVALSSTSIRGCRRCDRDGEGGREGGGVTLDSCDVL